MRSNVKLLTTAAMVDYLDEKVDECPLNQGRSVLLAYNWDCKNCPLYEVAGCPLFRGCLSIEVNERAVGTLRIVCYIVGVRYSGVSVKQGFTAYKYMLVEFFLYIYMYEVLPYLVREEKQREKKEGGREEGEGREK